MRPNTLYAAVNGAVEWSLSAIKVAVVGLRVAIFNEYVQTPIPARQAENCWTTRPIPEWRSTLRGRQLGAYGDPNKATAQTIRADVILVSKHAATIISSAVGGRLLCKPQSRRYS